MLFSFLCVETTSLGSEIIKPGPPPVPALCESQRETEGRWDVETGALDYLHVFVNWT